VVSGRDRGQIQTVTMQDQTRNESPIRVIRPEELSEDTVQTSGSHGLAAIAGELATFLRCGKVIHRLGGRSDGDSPSRKAGHSCIRVGSCCSDPSGTPRGIPPAARPGGLVYVLAYLSQKEINLSNNAESSWVVVRCHPAAHRRHPHGRLLVAATENTEAPRAMRL
jgi:hypothetical protein